MAGFKVIEIQSRQTRELIDITSSVQEYITASGCPSGLILVYTPHTTAGITINENADPDVRHDIKEFLNRQVSKQDFFRHSEGNSPAHIQSSLIGASQTLIIENGQLVLGTWQGIFFCEWDGPRCRQIYLKIIPDSSRS